MATTQRIAERLPEFYRTREVDSVLRQFLDSFGKSLSEAEKDLVRVLRGHWVDTAKGLSLDMLGATFNLRRRHAELDSSFRRRIKIAVSEFKGGGTVASIQLALRTLLNPFGDEVLIEEFPATPITIDKEVSSGDVWSLASLGISAAKPEVTIVLAEKSAEVRDPRVTNITLNLSIGMLGLMKSGQELTLRDGRAYLDGDEVNSSANTQTNPDIPRARSDWQYSEFLQGRLGLFDSATFDESFFATPLPKVKIRFDWTTRKSSTIAITIPRATLDKTGLTKDEVAKMLDSVKSTGIEVLVNIQEPSSKRIVTQIVTPTTRKGPISMPEAKAPPARKEVEIPA